jgi:hypothetical protein
MSFGAQTRLTSEADLIVPFSYRVEQAVNSAEAKFPDEIERWPVKMLVAFDPVELKRSFRELATKILADNSGKS